MSPSLPEHPSLEQLRKQAKDLLKAQRSGQPSACPVLRHLHRFANAADADILKAHLTLSEAQRALAKAYGFEDWAAMVRAVEEAPSLTLAGKLYRFASPKSPALDGQEKHIPGWRGAITCEVCGKPSTIHLTERVDGKMLSRHFCQEHDGGNLPGAWIGGRDYPLRHVLTISVTQEQVDRQDTVPVGLPDGTVLFQMQLSPRAVADRKTVITGPFGDKADRFCVQVTVNITPNAARP